GLGNARPAEQHDGGIDVMLAQAEFGLEVFELETNPANILRGQEFIIGEGQAIGGALRLRRRWRLARGGDVFLGGAQRRRMASGQISSPFLSALSGANTPQSASSALRA